MMMRTTVDIDTPILKELKRVQKREGKPLGRLISDLLAFALSHRGETEPSRRDFGWISRDMAAHYDPGDHDAILDAMDEPAEREEQR